MNLRITLSPNQVRELIKQAESRLRSRQEFKYVVLYFDVDGAQGFLIYDLRLNAIAIGLIFNFLFFYASFR